LLQVLDLGTRQPLIWCAALCGLFLVLFLVILIFLVIRIWIRGIWDRGKSRGWRNQRLEEKKYTAGQIDARWTPAIEDDYRAWLKQNEDHLSVSRGRVEEILRDHE